MIETGGVCCDTVVQTFNTVALLRCGGAVTGLETVLILRKP